MLSEKLLQLSQPSLLSVFKIRQFISYCNALFNICLLKIYLILSLLSSLRWFVSYVKKLSKYFATDIYNE